MDYYECDCDEGKNEVFCADYYPAFCPCCGKKLVREYPGTFPGAVWALTKAKRDEIFDDD